MTVDLTGRCEQCAHPIEHVAGEPGNDWQPPFWRHVGPRPHPAVPQPESVQPVTEGAPS